MINVILFLSGYVSITFIVSLIFAKFNSKIYAFLEDGNHGKYESFNIIFISGLWPLLPFIFILVGWHTLIEKISK